MANSPSSKCIDVRITNYMSPTYWGSEWYKNLDATWTHNWKVTIITNSIFRALLTQECTKLIPPLAVSSINPWRYIREYGE